MARVHQPGFNGARRNLQGGGNFCHRQSFQVEQRQGGAMMGRQTGQQRVQLID